MLKKELVEILYALIVVYGKKKGEYLYEKIIKLITL